MTRTGGPGSLLKIRVEIDKLGDMKLGITNLFNGRKIVGKNWVQVKIIFDSLIWLEVARRFFTPFCSGDRILIHKNKRTCGD